MLTLAKEKLKLHQGCYILGYINYNTRWTHCNIVQLFEFANRRKVTFMVLSLCTALINI